MKTKETPDIVVYFATPSPKLLAIEAKMFTPTSRKTLVAQMSTQRLALNALAPSLGMDADSDICHLALLPDKKHGEMTGRSIAISDPTWSWAASFQACEEG